MNAIDVIEAYVAEVAAHLPRKQRSDVAFELRALLQEELQAKARAAGGDADGAMATELLQAFGRPADVAARYRPALMIIDPADGHRFLRLAAIGLAIIWCGGLVRPLQQAGEPGSNLLGAIAQWWLGTAIPSLWWPGVLVVWFALAAWSRRRWPDTSVWKPRSADRSPGGRSAMVMGVVGMVLGLAVLLDPRRLLDLFFGGRAAPAAYDALTYTESFLRGQAPWLFALIVLNVPLWIVVIVQGRWSARMRRVEAGLSLVTCAVMIWTALSGPVLVGPSGDQMARLALWVIAGLTLIHMVIKLRRSVRPAPDPSAGWGERTTQ